ncbi:dUTP diphosphatase [Bacillus tropicus]|uniref:dUTP diphosphatase n=1 Tax=Bacillus tropicus TaxID=2026188 RepID=UPI0013D390BE|nr:dUTP diphosphatase [Bacillus tropicus]
MFNLQSIFERQEKLDAAFVKERGLEGINLTANTTTALYVELGELANEIEFFKHWKVNRKQDNINDQWEEFADCLHFLPSLGNMYGHTDFVLSDKGQDIIKTSLEYDIRTGQTLNQLFSLIYRTNFSNQVDYTFALASLIRIGQLIGMDFDDMYEAYKAKNDKNYNRIANKY